MQLRALPRAHGRAGFTLVELMTVCAIIGILSLIGIILVNRHFKASKSLESTSIIQGIRACQEQRRAETGSYLNVSANNVWYPKTPDGKKKTSWVVTTAVNADADRWQQLGVSRTDGTQFGFKTWAGLPGALTTAQSQVKSDVTLPAQDDLWYVVEGAGDLDSDSTLSLFLARSWDAELVIQDETE